MGFHITQKTPAVTSLPIHLPNSNRHRQYSRRDGSESKLSRLDHYFLRPDGVFNRNGVSREFKTLTYLEYFSLFRLSQYDARNDGRPNFYIEKPNHVNSPRNHVILRSTTQNHIARLDSIRPTQGEVFYLRCILSQKSASSFVDARTIDDTLYETYQEAATVMGLFEDEDEATHAFTEAIQDLRTPAQLRILFIHLLINDCIPTPMMFWTTFANDLSLDFTLRNSNSLELGQNAALRDLGRMLSEYGKSLESYGLPMAEIYRPEVSYELERWEQHRTYLAERASQVEQLLNEEQKLVYDTVVQSINSGTPLYLFVEGNAGTGKTTAIQTVCDKIRSCGQIVLPTATSAFAAQLYDGGRTVHSTFKVITASHVIHVLKLR